MKVNSELKRVLILRLWIGRVRAEFPSAREHGPCVSETHGRTGVEVLSLAKLHSDMLIGVR
jgi:hypothetical protein